jgi:UDP-N-acetylmuramoyl-L-alanyl-D-glutamate--2,6-diaminopimelate ligase
VSADNLSSGKINLIDIKGLSLNSKLVKSGDLFFCISGLHHKGSDFISEARKNGAVCVIVGEKIRAKVLADMVVVKVKDVIRCLGVIANKFYKETLDEIYAVGITGTNGKTSITYIIESILLAHGKKAGVMGTVNYRFGSEHSIAKNTTPDILTIYEFIEKMFNKRIKHLIMEVSSHALAQRRIEGLKFNQAIFTNLGQDHFDFHKTKSNYFSTKSKLFHDYLKNKGVAVINIDDDYGLKIIKTLNKSKKYKVYSYGINKKADINARNILADDSGCSFEIETTKHKLKVETNLIGEFNVYNILASTAACLHLGIPVNSIVKGLKHIYIPGRLELVSLDNKIRIFIDYAHTEQALRNVLSSLRRQKGQGRLIVVFGCGGNRDKDKRHKMGRAASELADFSIITSDNPRFESPKAIISDIEKGLINNNYLAIIDRKAAIKKAIDMAGRQDIVLIAGKGHEDYQIIRDRRVAFNDKIAIKEILSKKGISQCFN